VSRFYWGFFLVLISLNSIQALGSEDEKKKKAELVITHEDIEKYGHQEALMELGPSGPKTKTISPSEIFARTQFVLDYLKLTPEPSYQKELDAFSKLQTIEGLNKLLPFFDEKKQLSRFTAYLNSDPNQIYVFKDRDAREPINEDFNLALTSTSPVQNTIATHLRATASQPLAGLRIALDPGHMGGKIWDDRTGKFVTDHKGHTISEGVINLQTCLLLKERFEKEGAVVMVTHENVGAVTDVKWEDLDYSKYIPGRIFESTLETWFLNLVAQAPAGKSLQDLVDKDAHIKEIKAKSVANQWEDFVLREDINVRAQKIEEFQPDITLVIHYDTSDPKDDPNGVGTKKTDFTKAYVPGGFDPTEFASRAFRRDLAKHIFNPYWWNASVSLASSVVSELSKQLGIKPDRGLDGDAVALAPGLQSRNLNLTRMIADSAIAYVECLYYNDPREFAAFLKADNSMTIGGTKYSYSNRLVKVVDSIEAGVLDFTKNLN
jgi:N-acetylmuramoyl-L-alanine amidase